MNPHMDRFDSNSKSSYLFTTKQPKMSSISSMEKGESSRGKSCLVKVGLFCGGGLLGVVSTILALGSVAYFCGMYKEYVDLESCFDVNLNKSTILKIDNVTSSIGEEVDVECIVVNYGLSNFQTQKVYWTGPNFQAEAGPGAETKIHEGPAGVTVIGKEINETFMCSNFLPLNGSVTVRVLIFTLTIIPTKVHQGLYTCTTNYTVAAGHQYFGAHVSSESFHLSVD